MKAFLTRAVDAARAFVAAEPVRVRAGVAAVLGAGATALAEVGVNVPDGVLSAVVVAVVWCAGEFARGKVAPVAVPPASDAR